MDVNYKQMAKRNLIFMFSVVLLCCITAGAVAFLYGNETKAETNEDYTQYFTRTNNNTISGLTPEGEVWLGWHAGFLDIPRNIGVNLITAIGNSAFSDNTLITQLRIPDSVTSIGNSAFYRCWNLTEVIIPDSVTYIGAYAFQGNSAESVTFGANVTHIGNYSFIGLDNCKVIYYNATNCTYVGDDGNSPDIFKRGNTESINFIIGDNVTRIPSKLFSCYDYPPPVRTLTIPGSVQTIGDSALNTPYLTEVTLLRSLSEYSTITALDSTNVFNTTNLQAIYVHPDMVYAYKSAPYWSTFASIIQGYAIDAQTPVITLTQLDPNIFYIGDTVTLSVTASVDDGGVLSYQWYRNTINSQPRRNLNQRRDGYDV